jgi:hypothetical protein
MHSDGTDKILKGCIQTAEPANSIVLDRYITAHGPAAEGHDAFIRPQGIKGLSNPFGHLAALICHGPPYADALTAKRFNGGPAMGQCI